MLGFRMILDKRTFMHFWGCVVWSPGSSPGAVMSEDACFVRIRMLGFRLVLDTRYFRAIIMLKAKLVPRHRVHPKREARGYQETSL